MIYSIDFYWNWIKTILYPTVPKALPNHSSEDARKLFKKAIEIYKDIDEIKEQEEDKLLEILEKIPIDRYIESEPVVNPVKFNIYTNNSLNL